MTDDTAIREITYDDAMRRFGAAMRASKLPTKPVNNCVYYANDYACGALVYINPPAKTLARIKATVTLPEWRGFGYGEQILLHLIDEATRNGCTRIEVFTEQPDWYLRHGFTEVRTAPWGTKVLASSLTKTPPVN